MLGTHFYVSPVDGRTTIFTLGVCETCGQLVQEANAVGTPEAPQKLERIGLKRSVVLPPEVRYNEDTGMTDCDREDCGLSVNRNPPEGFLSYADSLAE